MEKGESLKCKKDKSGQEKKPKNPEPSIWSRITNLTKWSDIITSSDKSNKNQNARKKNSNHKKQKEKSQTKTKKVTTPTKNTGTSRATKRQTAESKNNVYLPNKDTDRTTKTKFTLLENSTGGKQFQNQPDKARNQEVKKEFKTENQNVKWYTIVTAQQYYDSKENLAPDIRTTNEQQEAKRKKEKRRRIIALLKEKIKKLETQVRDLQFLNLRKSRQQVGINKNLIPQKLFKEKVKKLENLQEVKKKKDKLLAEKSGFKLENFQITKIKPDKIQLSKIGAQTRENENTKPKRNLHNLKNTNNEQTRNRNQAKESFIKSHNTKVIPQDMKLNLGTARSRGKIIYDTRSPKNNLIDKNEERTILFLIDRVKHLETQLKILNKNTIISSKNSNVPYLSRKNNLAEEIRNKIIRQNQLKINMRQHNPEYYQKKIRYEKRYTNFEPRKTKSQTKRDFEIQKNYLLASQQRLNNIVKKQKENTFIVLQEKLTQTSQLNLALAPKSENPIENQNDVSAIKGNNSYIVNSPGNDNNPANIQGTYTRKIKLLKQPDVAAINNRSDSTSEKCEKSSSNQKIQISLTEKSENINYNCKNETTGDGTAAKLLIRSDETTETVNKNYTNEMGINHNESKIFDENSNRDCELKRIFKKNLTDIRNFIEDEINRKQINDNSFNQNIKQTNKNSVSNSTKNQSGDANRTIKTQTGQYDLYKQKSYITAKERRSFDENERRIYESLKVRNINNNTNLTRINDNNSFIQIKISSKERQPNNTSLVEFQDITIHEGTRFNIPSSQGTSTSSYSSIHGDNQRIIPKIFSTEQNLQNKTQINCVLEGEAVKHRSAKSKPTGSPIGEDPFNLYTNENLINQEYKWKSTTTFPSLCNNHLKEINGDNSEINSTIFHKNFGYSNTQKYGVQIENDSDILMKVIQLKPTQIPIDNVSNVYLVLVNNKKNKAPKEIAEDKIREMVSNFRNSIDQLTKKENEEVKSDMLQNKNQSDTEKSKEDINDKINANNLCTSKNKETDSCITVKENEGSYTNTENDFNKNIKQNKNCKQSIENPKDTFNINETPQGLRPSSLITDTSKCVCPITGKNVFCPILNYSDYSKSISQSSCSVANKSSTNSKKKILKPNSNTILLVRLQKEIAQQRREVDELKSIWSKCSSHLENIWQSKILQHKSITSNDEKIESPFTKPTDRKMLIKTLNKTKRQEFIPHIQIKSDYKKCTNDYNKIPKNRILNPSEFSKMNNAYENTTSDNLSEITTEAGSNKNTLLTKMTSTYLLRKPHQLQGNSNLKNTFDSSSSQNYKSDPSTESYTCVTYSDLSDKSRLRTTERSTQTIKGGKNKHEPNMTRQTQTNKMKRVTFDQNNKSINTNGEKLILEAVRKNNKILVKEKI